MHFPDNCDVRLAMLSAPSPGTGAYVIATPPQLRTELALLNPLDTFADLSRWVGWRNEPREADGKLTKVPYCPATNRKAKANDPATWSTRDRAQAWACQHVKGAGEGGIGVELGDLPDGTALGGVDFDTCRDPDGNFTDWALNGMRALRSYAEVSPSGTGSKVFFRYDPAALLELRAAMGTEHGKSWKRGKGEHAPGIELHLGNRYFTVTGEHLHTTPSEVRHVSTETLLHLIRETGPAFVGTGKKAAGRAAAAAAPPGDLQARITAATAQHPMLGRRWAGDWTGLNDDSRSGHAMALAGALKRAGFNDADTRQALLLHRDTADWVREKGDANDGRELQRIFVAIGDGPRPDAHMPPEPNLAILARTALPAPGMPLQVFGPFWRAWIERTAEGSNAPPDYVAAPLLTAASALLGNARWVRSWRGWQEPPVLWLASVGNPSNGKSSGASPVVRDVMARVENTMGRGFEDELKAWAEKASVARIVEKDWERKVEKAVRAGAGVPNKPGEANAPPKPIRPRVRVSDVTVEKLADIYDGLPKGVLYARDELSGWFLNLSRYSNGGTDRPFFLEAYTGGSIQVDRKNRPDPVFLPSLSLPVFGTIQPDRLADVLEGADDGLASRFLWVWPDAKPFRRPPGTGDVAAAADALGRLARLAMLRDEEGRPVPSYVSLDDGAADTIEAFAIEMQRRENFAQGLLKSAIGKARGQALRLTIVLQYLWWCATPDIEPVTVSADAARAAVALMDGYFLPQAKRVLGDASVPGEERNARTLAHWIARTDPKVVNVSAIRDGARLDGLRESDAVKAACRYLAEAGWLIEAPHQRIGRPRGDYVVNPGLADALAIFENPKTEYSQKGENYASSPAEDGFSTFSPFSVLGPPKNAGFDGARSGASAGHPAAELPGDDVYEATR